MKSSRVAAGTRTEKFRCKRCGTQISRKFDLNRHQKDRHEGPQTCPEPGCPYQAQRKYRVKAHMKTRRHGIYHQPPPLMNLADVQHHEEDPASQLGGPSGASDQVILVNQSSATPPRQIHSHPTPSTGDLLEKIIESNFLHVADETRVLEERSAFIPSLINSLDFRLGAMRASSLAGDTTTLGQDYGIASQASHWDYQPPESAKFNSNPTSYLDQGQQQQWHPNSQVQISTQAPPSFPPASHEPACTNGPRMGIWPMSTESSTTFPTSQPSVPNPNRLIKSYETVSTLDYLDANSSTMARMPSSLWIPNNIARNNHAMLQPYPTSTMTHSQHAPPMDYNTITSSPSTSNLQKSFAAGGHGDSNESSSFKLPDDRYSSNLSSYVQQGASPASFQINSDHELPQYTYTGNDLSAPGWSFDDEHML